MEQPALEETPAEEGSSQTVVITDRVSSVSDDDGGFVLTLGDGVDIKGETATFTVSAPSGQRTGEDGRRRLEARPDRRSRGSALCSAFAGGAGRRGVDLAAVPGGRSSLRLPRHAAPGGTSGGHPGPAGGIERGRRGRGRRPGPRRRPSIVPAHSSATSRTRSSSKPWPSFRAAEPIPVPLDNGRIASRLLLRTEIERPAGESAHPEPCDCVDGAVPRLPTQEDPRPRARDLLGGPRRARLHQLQQAESRHRGVRLLQRHPHDRAGGTSPDARRRRPTRRERSGSERRRGGRADASGLLQRSTRHASARPEGHGGSGEPSCPPDGKRHMVLQEVPYILGPGSVTDYPDAFEESAFDLVEPTSRSWAVAENKDGTDAIGLDLRSVRQIEVVGAGASGAWALGGIGVSATTIDGDEVVIQIEGDDFHEETPYLHAFLKPTTDTPSAAWTANAGVAAAPSHMRTRCVWPGRDGPRPRQRSIPGFATRFARRCATRSSLRQAVRGGAGRAGRLGRDPDVVPGRRGRARTPAALQAALVRRRLLARRLALQPSACARPEEADLGRRLGATRADAADGDDHRAARAERSRHRATAISARS